MALLLCCACCCTSLLAQNLLVRSAPEEEGLRSENIDRFMNLLMQDNRIEVHSCIIMRHGHVIAEIYPNPWKASHRHTMYSVSKSFTSVAVGMCIADSLISLDDSLGRFFSPLFPEDKPDSVENITVRHLLTMQSGLPVDTKMRTREREWIKTLLAYTPVAPAGSRWAYDSMMSYLLSAIVQEVTDSTLMSFLQTRLFQPLGIQDAAWEESPEGVTCGGWGLYIRPEDMAKFGQLLLNEGEWHGVQLVPKDWVKQMTTPQSVTGRYGFHIWKSAYPGWVEANGAYGQVIYIIPEADMVVSLTQCNYENAPVAKWISRHLVDNCLPFSLPKPQNRTQLYKLSHPTPIGKKSPTKRILPITLSLEKNSLRWERVCLRTDKDTLMMDVKDEYGKEYCIRLGYGEWLESQVTGQPYCNPRFINNFSNLPTSWHVAGSYAWNNDNSIHVSLRWVDWISSAELQFSFSGVSAQLRFVPREVGKALTFKAWRL